MKISKVLVVGMRDDFQEVLSQAQKRAFPGVELVPLATFSEALSRPADERALVVLVEPTAPVLAGARTGLDAVGLPRWAVVAVGAQKPDTVVPWAGPEEWNDRTLALIFTLAVEKHQLARENARLRGDLLTISRRVNHDLRSSLNGVVTASEVIKEILTMDKPEDAELIQPVADSAAEIARLIDQVSFVAKATAAPSTPQALAMDELVWKGLSRVERKLHERKAKVGHVETWPTVLGVAAWIETIWATLILNAIQHGGPEPQIEIGWRDEGRQLRFWVEDRGPGVPLEKQGMLFTPFHQLADAGSVRGFGLPVVQRLLALQSGGGGYEAREGGGARFYFTLPKA